MSRNARRASVKLTFDGVDITESVTPYLLSLSYIDSEECEADDLQMTLQDRDGIWMESWLESMINSAAENGGDAVATKSAMYRVSAVGGVYVRSGPGSHHTQCGQLAYGNQVWVHSTKNKWCEIVYNGKTAYVDGRYLEPVNTGTGLHTGDTVTVTGVPYSTSSGLWPQKAVTGYEGVITHIDSGSDVPFPIYVAGLGWVAYHNAVPNENSFGTGKVAASRGLKLQAQITAQDWREAGKSLSLDCGQFELDDVDCSGPPAVIQIKATALPYTAQIRQTKKSRVWEAYYLSGIAKEIARVAGMACLCLGFEDPRYDRVEQYQTSDISFLEKLCQEAGLSLKAANNILILYDQANYERAVPKRTIRKGDGSYTKYRLRTSEAAVNYASCRVYWTTATGELIEGIARVEDFDASDTTNQQLEIRSQVASAAQAEKLAAKYLRLHNKYQKTASFTLPGDPTVIAGTTVLLEGWGAWNGQYIVSQAKHTVSSSYTTNVELRKVLEGY